MGVLSRLRIHPTIEKYLQLARDMAWVLTRKLLLNIQCRLDAWQGARNQLTSATCGLPLTLPHHSNGSSLPSVNGLGSKSNTDLSWNVRAQPYSPRSCGITGFIPGEVSLPSSLLTNNLSSVCLDLNDLNPSQEACLLYLSWCEDKMAEKPKKLI